MLLTRYTHSCVRLTKDDRVLVIDPAAFAEPEALYDAEAVLVTHEHADHVDPELLTAALQGNPELAVFTHPDVVTMLGEKGIAARPVLPGDTLDVAGFSVSVVGGAHAEIYAGLPGCANVGFVIDDDVYHPGDSVFVPEQQIRTLLVPAAGPWLKLNEAIDFVRRVAPARAHPIHDAISSEAGHGIADRWLGGHGGADYSRIAVGECVDTAV